MSRTAMAMWEGLRQAATVAQLSRVDPFGLIAMIMQAAMKAHSNKEECEQLAYRVSIIGGLLLELQQHKAQVTPSVLDELNQVLLEAHHFIQSFRERSALYQFVMAWKQEERLRGMKSKIDSALSLLPFANSINISCLDPNHSVLLPNVDMLAQPCPTASSPPTYQELEVADEEVVEIHGEGGEKFTVQELAAATNNWHPDREIGRSNSGTVYKGRLADGRKVAIKIMSDSGNHSMELFHAEASILICLEHKHIIRLYGTLTVLEKDSSGNDEDQVVCRMQVLEYMKNGSLADHIHGRRLSPSSPVRESWEKRIKILLGVSRGIKYLHNCAAVIHGDINSSNILLGSSWKPRLSGFEFSLAWECDDETETECYPDPEYEYEGTWSVTPASDVYSFGIVMLEVLTGKRAISYPEGGEDAYGAEPVIVPTKLIDVALPLIAAGELGKVLDQTPAAEPTRKQRKALRMVACTAARCLQFEEKDRPDISDIVDNLKQALELVRDNE